MWEIIRAELRYCRFGYFIFFATIPLLVMLNVMSQDGERVYVIWFVMAMALNFWNAKRIKEKRDFQLAQLPVSRKDAGWARALMVVLLPAAYLALYALVRGALARPGLSFSHLASMFALTVLVFALIFIFRDKYVGTRSLMRGKVMLLTILGVVFGAGVYTMIMTEEVADAGGEPPMALRAFNAVIQNHPFGHPLFVPIFLATSLLLVYASVLTFQRRRTNIE